ncbi:MAG: hypothetical protein HFH32_04900 [Eubacterium sp.]|nr:hypothetical protein [Eubacterium sp.]
MQDIIYKERFKRTICDIIFTMRQSRLKYNRKRKGFSGYHIFEGFQAAAGRTKKRIFKVWYFEGFQAAAGKTKKRVFKVYYFEGFRATAG